MHELPNRSLAVQRSALQSGALIPLKTELISGPDDRFQLRRLISATPKHLAKAGPKPNPFRPWDQRLEVASLPEHVVLLNKYPVQAGHLLLISKHWQAQADWLQPSDWQALTEVWAQQPGLWFFNSSAAAGASQPHRHLQLLPRVADQLPCPLDAEFEALAQGQSPAQTWQQSVAARELTSGSAEELQACYQGLAAELEIGSAISHQRPLHPYNLLLCNKWMVMVRRLKESHAGFSVNALGFAGYMLATEESDMNWLTSAGGDALLNQVSG